jgi:glycine cleavage system H protein
MDPADLKYSVDHEWISVTDGIGRVGITDYAQQQLGDVVYVELPDVGKSFKQGEQFGSIESVKAVSDLYCPVSGEVVEINTGLSEKPESVNRQAYETWLIAIKLSDLDELLRLLDADAYSELVV